MPLGYRAIAYRLRSRLVRLRRKAGLSQEEVALRAGITLQYYQSLESGRANNPTLKVLVGLARALGLEVSELVDFRRSA